MAFPTPSGPSLFAQDPNFKPRKGGRTQSQIAAETVARRTRENGGRNPGKIDGLSRADRAAVRDGLRTAYLNKSGVA
jgi:hypothetical protein